VKKRNVVRSHCHLLAPAAVKFEFIDEHRQEYPISIMCRVLDVSVSGFYAWKRRPVCPRKREDGELATRIEETFVQNRQVYGSPRIHAELQAQGIHCGRKRVVRLMQQLQLSARCPKKHIVTTKSDPTARFAPNVLQQNFEAQAPNTKWVADVTFIGTQAGWLYLAAVLDLFSRAIVGWAMATTQDEVLVTQALQMALARREVQADLLHHSDRGCQYTSDGYQQLLEAVLKGLGSRGKCARIEEKEGVRTGNRECWC
jgi:transposase InsO family protein